MQLSFAISLPSSKQRQTTLLHHHLKTFSKQTNTLHINHNYTNLFQSTHPHPSLTNSSFFIHLLINTEDPFDSTFTQSNTNKTSLFLFIHPHNNTPTLHINHPSFFQLSFHCTSLTHPHPHSHFQLLISFQQTTSFPSHLTPFSTLLLSFKPMPALALLLLLLSPFHISLTLLSFSSLSTQYRLSLHSNNKFSFHHLLPFQ